MQYVVAPNNFFSHKAPSGNVLWDATHFCPASALTPAEATMFWVFPLAEVPAPAYDPITQSLIELAPLSVSGVWTQQWAINTLPIDDAKANSIKDIEVNVIQRLNTFVRTRNYADTLSAVSYSGDADVQLNSDGTYMKYARSSTWIIVVNTTNEIQAGTRAPCNYATIEHLLPSLVWPTAAPVIAPYIYR